MVTGDKQGGLIMLWVPYAHTNELPPLSIDRILTDRPSQRSQTYRSIESPPTKISPDSSRKAQRKLLRFSGPRCTESSRAQRTAFLARQQF